MVTVDSALQMPLQMNLVCVGTGAADLLRCVQREDAIEVSIGNVATVPTNFFSRVSATLFFKAAQKATISEACGDILWPCKTA